MSPIIIGVIVSACLVAVIILRVPVAFALMITGTVGMFFIVPPHTALRFLSMDIFERFSSYTFSVIPMFILMGYFAAMTGMTERLYKVAYVWLGWMRGGLAVATIGACAAFAAVCGSSPAEAATIGKVAIPEMKRYKYDDALATGCIAAGGNLGPLIPPSNGMIIYALLTNQSVVKCLVSGIIPGIIQAILMGLTIYVMCRFNPNLGPPGSRTSWKEKFRALPGIVEALALFVFVIGGLFLGFFAPTQAASAGCFGALVIGLVRRNINLKALWSATKDAVLISCMVLFLVTGSVVFGHFLSLSTLSIVIVKWAQQLPLNPYVIYGIICLFYIVAGCFIDSLGLIVLTIPITAPVIFSLGFDPIWYGVIICVLAETGAITPPVGVNVFVIKGIAPEVPLQTIFRGIVPFFIAILVSLAIVTAVPSLATFLPNLVAK